MREFRWDHLLTGTLIGLAGGLVGFIIYGFYYSIAHPVTFGVFVNKVFLGNTILRAPILSLSILFNLVPFYLFLNRKMYQGARGVLAAIFIYAIFIVYYRFFS